MKDALISLTKRLIAISSVSDNPEALRKILELTLSQLSEFTIEKFEKNNFPSALIYNTHTRPDAFKIILNGHLDIIPGKDYQYKPKIIGNRLYGAGAMDMKASVACLITAFKDIAKRVTYPLALQLTTDEEPGGFNGTKYQIEQGIRTDFVIAGESTNLHIVNKAKGVLWVKVSARGRSAHGAYPWKGENAILRMQAFLSQLISQYPIPKDEQWKTTVNISSITTDNKTFNKIPDTCEVWLDIRYIPNEENTILNTIKTLLPEGFQIEIVENESPLYVDENNLYIKKLQEIIKRTTNNPVYCYGAQGTSDTRHYSTINCPGIEFGPIGGGIGSDEEWIDISSLKKYTQIIKEFLLSYNSKI